MARFRNPRFAPEFLEKRLSPSDLTPTSAIVITLGDPEPLPPDVPGDPVPTGPTSPGGPSIPG
jgi:hypothetical protein